MVPTFSKDGLLIKKNSTLDNRTRRISLTAKGTGLYNQLNKKSDKQIVRLVQGVSQKEIMEQHASMLLIQKKLDRLEKVEDDTI